MSLLENPYRQQHMSTYVDPFTRLNNSSWGPQDELSPTTEQAQENSKKTAHIFLENLLGPCWDDSTPLVRGGPSVSSYWLSVQKASSFMGFSCPSGIQGSLSCKGRKCDNCWKRSAAAHGSDSVLWSRHLVNG
jgi:hypothetical protein